MIKIKYYDYISKENVRKTPLKKVIRSKIEANKDLTFEEIERERQKYEIAEELGLADKVKKVGWSGLSASETGKIGGIMTKRNKLRREECMKNGNKPTW